jgi:acyl carrier protein
MSAAVEAADAIQALQEIFAEELDEVGLRLTASDTPDSIADWDSLAHIRIIAATEERFGFQFDLAELDELKSVQAIVDAIRARA